MSMAHFKIYSTISVALSRIIYVSGFNRCWIHVVLVWHVFWKTSSCIVWISLLVLMDVSMAEQHEFRKYYKKLAVFGQNFFQMQLGNVGFGELARVEHLLKQSLIKPWFMQVLCSKELEKSFLWLLSPIQDSWKQSHFVSSTIIDTEL